MQLRLLRATALGVVGSWLVVSDGWAAPIAAEGFSHVRTVGEIAEYRLDANDLMVLVQEDHSSPTATFMVTYRVGSRHEVTGTTGATHLLEHLMFKGSENFNQERGNIVWQYLGEVGGRYNATTWNDRTNYFATLGRDHLEGYIAIEADRMRHSWLREEDRRREMTVVRNEFERGENNPSAALEKEVWAAAFQAHPYHHDTIGWRSDIERVPIEKLREFYDTFYWPNNATVTVVGDIETGTALALVRKYFGPIPRSPKSIPTIYTEEPAQTGPRRVTVRRAGQLGLVQVAHKIPATRHPDFPALIVASAILGDGKKSRLYQALTDRGLTNSVSTALGRFHDPALHLVFATAAPGVAHEDVERALLAEIERLKTEGVSEEELRAAIAKERAATAYGRDGSYAVARALNECIAAGDWTLYHTLPQAVEQVSADDVRRVAQTYFNEDQSTTGWFVPTAGRAGL